jgi:hypothetical protein
MKNGEAVRQGDGATASRRKFSFLVSFWFEPGSAGISPGDGWRGSVEHLGSGRRLYFNHIASLVAFLTSWLERRGPG